MRLVVNASPLIFLSKVDTLVMLPALFSEILIPPTVITEIGGLPLPPFVRPATLSAEGNAYVRGAVGRLHAGELEAMVLARERQADFVALDDLLARRRARQMDLVPIGTLGLLLLAQRRGLLDAVAVREKIRVLVEAQGLYLSSVVLGEVEKALGPKG